MHIVFPRRNPRVPILEIRPGHFRFGDFPEILQLLPEQKRWLLDLTGDKSAEDAVQLFVENNAQLDASTESLHRIIRLGLCSAAILDGNTVPTIARWRPHKTHDIESEFTHAQLTYSGSGQHDVAGTIDVRCATRVYVSGVNHLARQIRSFVRIAGFQLTDSAAQASIHVLPSISHAEVLDHDFSHEEQLPHIHVGIRHDKSMVGPLVIPGQSSCLRCAYLHRRDQDLTWPQQVIGWRNSIQFSTADPILTYTTAAFTVNVIRTWIDGFHPTNRAWSSSLPLPVFREEPRPAHPLCGCQLTFLSHLSAESPIETGIPTRAITHQRSQ